MLYDEAKAKDKDIKIYDGEDLACCLRTAYAASPNLLGFCNLLPQFNGFFFTSFCLSWLVHNLTKGMWHALTSGELDEDIDQVFKDSTKWILDRV